ncbi:hypothetical protein BUALT_Bualt13G0071600 [Buddleja alternifolia]|uniref:Transposase MuDR plant domain-containing protein n=1 Tax=Buddleja alternifolia TaxID=168488 RepID=A0AAV6WQW4_9LAMI|nr:hypothetical protein BUALT_Bualt13G0071600 [Buddleja alternifolia]
MNFEIDIVRNMGASNSSLAHLSVLKSSKSPPLHHRCRSIIESYKMVLDNLKRVPKSCSNENTKVNFQTLMMMLDGIDVFDSGIPIEIGVDELDDPVVPFATPMNMVPLQMEVSLSQEDKLQFLLIDIDFNDSYESVATQEFSRGFDGEAERTETVEEQAAGDTEQMDELVADEENVGGLESVQEDAEVVDKIEGHNFAQGWDAFLQEDEEEVTEPIEMAQSRASRAAFSRKGKVSEEENCEVDAMAQSRATEKGKGKMAEQNIPFTVDEEDSRSEFDDSSDEDYVEPDDSGDDEEGYKSTKGINIREGEGPKQYLHGDWYSDPREEDELLSLDGSDDEIGREVDLDTVFFKEGECNMKGKSLIVGMKLRNFRVYREVLRDYCVRNEFDVEYIRNESGRIIMTCKNQNCKWRLHASAIQNTIIFQIKSLKGEHSCAKTFNNKLAKSSYIAKRLEQMIRDNPHVSNDQLRNAINRKCGVEVSSAKVSRAKREAIDKIVGLVVQVENYERWKWFLSVLLEDIGEMESTSKWTFISDRHKGFIEAILELAPYAEHRFC